MNKVINPEHHSLFRHFGRREKSPWIYLEPSEMYARFRLAVLIDMTEQDVVNVRRESNALINTGR